ncbi:hypothetical protein ABPG73_012931 [Tetrahymena malaccensis]
MFKIFQKLSYRNNKLGSLLVQNKAMFSTAAAQAVQLGTAGRSIQSRAGIFRALLVIGGAHIAATYGGSMFQDKQVTMSVQDYMLSDYIKPESKFQIFGVLKVGSTKMQRGSLETRFVITDFKEEIEVFYKGITKFEFKEGETIVLTAYCPDLKERKKVVAIDYLTKHSMEVQDWQSKSGKSRENYGLYKQQTNVI